MTDILTKQVDRGFDANIRDATELPRGSAADGSQNVLYSRGTIKSPYGFAKVGSQLDSGNTVLALGVFSELDKTQHFLAVTNDKIYDRNYVTEAWDEVTQDADTTPKDFGANIENPVSMAAILHTDGLNLDGGAVPWYHHVLVCNGITPIQRWAGKYELNFADLKGSEGYHHVSSDYYSTSKTHFALQVAAFFNRAMLISPKESQTL